MQNQRKHIRIETKALVDYSGTNALIDHKIRDISLGGLRIETDFIEEEGTEVDLFIQLPEIQESFEAKGVVVWTNKEGPSDMGIKFTDLSKEAKEKLKRYIDYIKKQRGYDE